VVRTVAGKGKKEKKKKGKGKGRGSGFADEIYFLSSVDCPGPEGGGGMSSETFVVSCSPGKGEKEGKKKKRGGRETRIFKFPF